METTSSRSQNGFVPSNSAGAIPGWRGPGSRCDQLTTSRPSYDGSFSMPLLKQSRWRLAAALPLILLAAVFAADPPNSAERLEQHRNLGKAFYENPTTQAQAVAEFKKALELAPHSKREKLNYGLALLRAGKTSRGRGAVEGGPARRSETAAHLVQSRHLLKKNGEADQAIRQFERMEAWCRRSRLCTTNWVPYKLQDKRMPRSRSSNARPGWTRAWPPRAFSSTICTARPAGGEDAAEALAPFQELKKQSEGAAIPEDVDWSSYAEIYDPPARSDAANDGAAHRSQQIVWPSIRPERGESDLLSGPPRHRHSFAAAWSAPGTPASAVSTA